MRKEPESPRVMELKTTNRRLGRSDGRENEKAEVRPTSMMPRTTVKRRLSWQGDLGLPAPGLGRPTAETTNGHPSLERCSSPIDNLLRLQRGYGLRNRDVADLLSCSTSRWAALRRGSARLSRDELRRLKFLDAVLSLSDSH